MKMNSLRGLLFLLILFSGSIVFGQTITGTVTGDNFPLPGVNIAVEGTQKGTVTDFDGLYSIDGVQAGDVLVFSSIGFATKKVTAIGNAVIDVNLEEDVTALEDVVVVGYTKKTRDKLTTAVSTVKAEELSEIPAATINDALEGRSSGVRVASNGSPGENKPVIIRGLSTFGDATPLYVVDGVFVDNISQISPEAIAKVDILKDAAATAVYGSRGSNGVIIVTTKRGKSGKPKFGFSTYTGVRFLNKSLLPDLVSGQDLVNILTEEDVAATTISAQGAVENVGNQTPNRFSLPGFESANTDFTDAVFRDAEIRNYNIDFSGGSDKATFSINAAHFDEEGIAKETRFRRYSLNINSEFKVLDKFRVGQSFNIGYSRANLPILFQGRTLQQLAVGQPNFLPITNEDGLFVNPERMLDNTLANVTNPLLALAVSANEQTQFSSYGNIYGEIDLFKGLVFRNSFSFNIFNQEQDSQVDSIATDGDAAILVGEGAVSEKVLRFQRNNSLQTTLTSQLSYNRTFGNHNINGSVIFERVDNTSRSFSVVNASSVPNSFTQFNQNGRTRADSNELPDILTSYVGLAGYSYNNKYFINGSIRRDASSKFSDPVGIFPSVSGAWTLSNESFFDPLSGVFSNVKLRAGYGVTGNNRIAPFQGNVNLVAQDAPNIGGGASLNGFNLRGQVQEDLTWETSRKENYGIELGLLGNKITLTGEYYNNRNEDLIALAAISPSAADAVVGNVGTSRTNGYEFSLGYNDNVGSFKWSFWGQVTTAETEILEINSSTGAQELIGQPLRVTDNRTEPGVSRIRIGNPIWGIYGDRTDGLYRSVGEVVNDPNSQGFFVDQTLQGTQRSSLVRTFNSNGEAVFTNSNTGAIVDRENVILDDQRGTAPGDIRFTESDVLIGDPNPDFSYSFNLKAEYKGFDASALFVGVQGVDVVNGLSLVQNSFFGVSTASSDILDRFSTTNTTSNFPRFTASDPNENVRISDRFIEDGSYLRLRSVILGYSIKPESLQSILSGSLEKLRFYVQGQNLFTLTDYSGLDPEIRPSFAIDETGLFTNTIGGLGVDRGTAPAPVSFIFGLQVGF